MTSWLHFWSDESAVDVWGWTQGPNPLGQPITVPWGRDRLDLGDRLYIVNVNWPGTRVDLLGRIEVGRVERDPDDTCGAVVTAKRGSASRTRGIPILAQAVDRLVFKHADGRLHHFKRNATGGVVAGQFQGRSSLRELVQGEHLLEDVLNKNDF